MPNRVRILTVPDADRVKLEQRVRDRGVQARVAERARIVLLSAEGLTGPQIAQRVGCTEPTVIKWRRQYAEDGLAGLEDAAPAGRSEERADRGGDQHDPVGDSDAAAGGAAGDGRDALVEPAAGGLAAQEEEAGGQPRLDHPPVAAVLPAAAPHRGFKFSTDPQLEARVRDVVGLYLNPPDNAVVVCIDEKSQCQALERSQPILPMRSGIPERQAHDYVRHGVTCLFAALEVATGTVTDACYPRHRHQEFLKFLKKVAAAYPGTGLHVICDNYSTHKHADVRKWLARPENQRVTLHFTPTGCSWINLVECFFSVITRQAIRRGSFTSVRDLVTAIGAFIDHWNDHPHPFAWTKDADEILASIHRAKTKTSRLTYH